MTLANNISFSSRQDLNSYYYKNKFVKNDDIEITTLEKSIH